jgi:hypothetical protein
MTEPLDLLRRPDRPVAPSSEFRRELLERIRREAATMPESSTISAASPLAGFSTPHVTIGLAEAYERTTVKGAWFRRPVAAVLGALVTVVAIGSAGFLFRSSIDSEPPIESTVTVTTEPQLRGSTPLATGEFDGTTAVLPVGFSPVAATAFDGGFLIVATDTPPDSSERPAMDATLFVADADGVRPVRELTDRPVQVVWDGSFAWVAHFETGTVSKIDPVEGTVLGSVTPELAQPVTSEETDNSSPTILKPVWGRYGFSPHEGRWHRSTPPPSKFDGSSS